MRRTARVVTGVIFLAAAGCTANRPAADPPADRPSPPDLSAAARAAGLTGREWQLIAFGDRPAPLGAGGRAATMGFDLADGRAGGFAGCNRYSASYSLNGDTLTFGPAVSTKMACDAGMELETSFLSTLGSVRRFELADSMLVLRGESDVLARFR